MGEIVVGSSDVTLVSDVGSDLGRDTEVSLVSLGSESVRVGGCGAGGEEVPDGNYTSTSVGSGRE